MCKYILCLCTFLCGCSGYNYDIGDMGRCHIDLWVSLCRVPVTAHQTVVAGTGVAAALLSGNSAVVAAAVSGAFTRP
jgi:hypothetical protein